VVISEPEHCHREPCAAECGDLNPEQSRTEKNTFQISPKNAKSSRKGMPANNVIYR